MNDGSRRADQTEEQILADEVSDAAWEAAASDAGAGFTLSVVLLYCRFC